MCCDKLNSEGIGCPALLNCGLVEGIFLQNLAQPNTQYLVINFFGVFRVTITAKPMKRKDRTAEKRQPSPERFSGDGSAPPRLSVWFSAPLLLPFRGVSLSAARVSAAHLSMPSTRHGAKVAIK